MYGKLFASMYDGSLAMVGPWQALVTFQQLIVLADYEGFVDMTAEAISRRTIIPLEIIKEGIKVLEQPDPQSRDSTNEGRRIERISDNREWGWKILNYIKYRQIRNADERRAYMREHMREKRAKEKANPQVVPPSFDEFWKLYPRKVGKGAAEKAWIKHAKTDELAATIFAEVTAQSKSEQWLRDGGKFIPHPATWLNQRRWEDEGVTTNFGRCKYCSSPAIGILNGHGHCGRDQHIAWAKQGA